MKRIASVLVPLVLGSTGFFNADLAAAPIVGEISFDGSYTTNQTNLTLATAFLSFTGVTVSNGPTGDYAGLAGAAVTHTAFSFDPLPPGGVIPLWSIPSSPGTTFDLLTVSIDFEMPSILLLSGTGMAHMAGRDDTPGTWVMSANTLGTTFSFSSTNAAVPEPGTALFGLAIAGVATVRRRR